MEIGQATLVDNVHCALKHGFRFRREAGDQIRTEHDVGAQFAYLAAELDRVSSEMSPLHAL